MQLSKIGKKGRYDIGSLPSIGIAFIIIGIVLGAGALVLSKFNDKLTAGSIQSQAVLNASEGIKEVSEFLPTIGIIVAIAVIIGIVMFSLGGGGKR